MFQRLSAGLFLAALVLGVATPAQAAGEDLRIDGISVKVEPLRKTTLSKMIIRVNLGGTPGFLPDTDLSWVEIESDSTDAWDVLDLQKTDKPDVLQAVTYISNDVPTGKWWLHVNAWADWRNGGSDYVSKDWAKSFYVRKSTDLTVNATPEPVAAGQKVTVGGKLLRLSTGSVYDRSDARYVPYSGKTVKIYFDPAGSTPRKYVTSAVTTSTGTFSKKITALRDGTWIVEFAGTANFAAAKKGDFVDVR